jgi:hypothetical protein
MSHHTWCPHFLKEEIGFKKIKVEDDKTFSFYCILPSDFRKYKI